MPDVDQAPRPRLPEDQARLAIHAARTASVYGEPLANVVESLVKLSRQ